MKIAVFSILLLGLWTIPSNALAAEIEVEDLGDGQSMIVLTGEIKSEDSIAFNRTAAQLDNAIVVLESEGGSTVEAIKIGETIRIKGFSTIVLNGSYCASACALIWLAGSPRVLTKSARVGFHATYIDEDGRKLESGVGNALVGRYFAILNLPQRAIIFATSAPPSSVNWLSQSNATATGIETNFVDDFEAETQSLTTGETRIPPPRINVAPAPPPIQTYRTPSKAETTLWARVGSWSVLTDHTLGESCFMIKGFPDGTTFRLGFDLKFNQRSFFMIGNSDWASIEVGKEYPITMQLGNNDPWEARTLGVKLGNLVVLQATFEGTEFWNEFADANVMRLTRNGREFSRLSLEGTSPAIDEVIACQKEANKVRLARDPFSK